MSDDSKFKSALEKLGTIMQEEENAFGKEANDWWAKLPYEERLKAFFCVMERVVKGELEENGSYRYILYDIFEFGPESYGIGMSCGFMDLHNSIDSEVKKFK